MYALSSLIIFTAHDDLINRADILHRDISLTNLMINRGTAYPRECLLIDLGYAKLLKKEKSSATKENNPPGSSSKNKPPKQEAKTQKVLGIRLENRSDYQIWGNMAPTNANTEGAASSKKKVSGAPKLDSIKESIQKLAICNSDEKISATDKGKACSDASNPAENPLGTESAAKSKQVLTEKDAGSGNTTGKPKSAICLIKNFKKAQCSQLRQTSKWRILIGHKLRDKRQRQMSKATT